MDNLISGVAVVLLVLVGFMLLNVLGVLAAGAEETARVRRVARAERRTWERLPADLSLVENFSGPPFHLGRDRKVTDAYRGDQQGRSFVTFDYAFTSDDPHPSSRQVYSVLVLELERAAPRVSIVPRDAPVPYFDRADPEVEVDHPGFAHRFSVRSTSRVFARAVAHPNLIGRPTVAWRYDGRTLLCVHPGAQGPYQVRSLVELMSAVVDRVPPEAWETPEA